MKILFVHQYCGAMGGAETDILLGAGSLKNRGHSVALLYASRTGRGEEAWEQTFSERFPLAAHTKLEAVRGVLRKFAPEVIYYHSLPDLGVLGELLNSPAPVVR